MFRIPESKCKVCGKSYTQYRRTQRYCSNRCRQKAIKNYSERKKTPVVTKACVSCGNYFNTHIRTKVYCSTKCYLEHKDKQYVPVPVSSHVCPICGNTFVTAHASKVYCSHACYAESAVLRREEKHDANIQTD